MVSSARSVVKLRKVIVRGIGDAKLGKVELVGKGNWDHMSDEMRRNYFVFFPKENFAVTLCNLVCKSIVVQSPGIYFEAYNVAVDDIMTIIDGPQFTLYNCRAAKTNIRNAKDRRPM